MKLPPSAYVVALVVIVAAMSAAFAIVSWTMPDPKPHTFSEPGAKTVSSWFKRRHVDGITVDPSEDAAADGRAPDRTKLKSS